MIAENKKVNGTNADISDNLSYETVYASEVSSARVCLVSVLQT